MSTHVVQSAEWGKFKTEYGTKAVRVDGVQYTIHKIPLTNYFYAYSPRVNPLKIDFEKLEVSLKENKCIAINFDVPNVLVDGSNVEKNIEILRAKCVRAPRDTFAKANILLDLQPEENDLLANMHKKHRYNIKVAQKEGVTVKRAVDMSDFDNFYRLLAETAVRQKYFIHPKGYYEKLWKRLQPLEMAHILTAEYQGEALASWMLLVHDRVLYYPYGGSSDKHKNLFGSNLVGWEAIRLGKELECHTFDMWGAANNPEDEKDTYHGFTNFKMKFGGKHVTYINSYDFVVDKNKYKLFNLTNYLRWKILKLIR